jgi:hypothetical protein
VKAPDDPPAALRRAGALVSAEGAALAALGIGYALSGVLGEPEDRLATVLAGLLALLLGGALVPVGRGLARARGWALAPTIVVQLFMGIVAVGLFQGRVLWAALPLLLAAGAVLYLLSTRESRDVLRDSA